MRIYTSSWFQRLPMETVRIEISRRQPRYKPKALEFPPLAPDPWFNSVDDETFSRLYIEQLDRLDAETVLRELASISHGKDVALLCFEMAPGGPWCHRSLVSAWFYDCLRVEIFEFGFETLGRGWHHPKLPKQCHAGRKRP